MRQFPRPLSLVARVGFALVWMIGMVGPLPATPVAASAPARESASAPAGVAPSNDDFANAQAITLPPTFTVVVDMSFASSEYSTGEPFPCGNTDVPTVWYQFTPADSGIYDFSGEGSNIDHAIALYSGTSFDDLLLLDCNSQTNPNWVDLTALLSAGSTYYIQLARSDISLQGAQAGPEIALTVSGLASITGTVWDDLDGDGLQDGGEPGLPGASVTLYDDFDTPLTFLTTDANGQYEFSAVAIDLNYYLQFAPPPPGLLGGSPQDAGSDDTIDSDAAPDSGKTAIFSLDSLEVGDYDAGFGDLALISGRAWRDLNSSDQQDLGEPGLQAVLVCLQSNLAVSIAIPLDCFADTNTAADGSYSFSVLPGDYSLIFVDVADYTRADPNMGSDSTDSDADLVEGRVPTFTVALGDVVAYDAGYQTTGLGGRIWRDFNADGLQDPGEPGMPGMDVDLYDSADTFLLTAYTDSNGDYAFVGLAPGDYYIIFNLPDLNGFTIQDVGADDTIDSDADISTGESQLVNLTAGELDLTVDAGYTKSAFIVDNLSEAGDTDGSDGLCIDNASVAAPPYGVCSLRAAIEQANYNTDFDVILFSSAVFSVPLTIPQTSVYFIQYGVWVDGPGSDQLTLDANSTDRHFVISSDANVRLAGLRLWRGHAASDSGGSLYNAGQLTLSNVTIADSSADFDGGAIHNESVAALTNVVISGAVATRGGAIYNLGTLSATNSLLEANFADDSGGAIYNLGQMLVTSSIISGNVASDGSGGGVFNGGTFTGADLAITHNRAYWNGGGLANEFFGDGQAVNCLSAGPTGCFIEQMPAITLTDSSLVAHNLAGVADDYPHYGGGIYNGFGTVLIDHTEVNSNTIYGFGGGIYNEGNGNFTTAAFSNFCFYCPGLLVVQGDSALAFNTAYTTTLADPPATYPGLGGGLYNRGLAFVNASRLSDNLANAGGGFYNASFQSCFCAAEISPAYQPTLFIENNSLVTLNYAQTDQSVEWPTAPLDERIGIGGGGVNAGHAEILDSQVQLNTAAYYGGGLFNGFINSFVLGAEQAPAGPSFLVLPKLLIQNSLVDRNSADPLDDGSALGMGGGVFNLFGDVDVDASTILSNTAGEWGGGLVNGCIFCFIGSVAADAAPQGPGFLILVLFSRLYVHNDSLIIGNGANPAAYSNFFFGAAGGGLFNSGLAVIEDSAVVSNTAYGAGIGDGIGGGIANIAFLTIYTSAVDHNRSDGDGGGLFNDFFFGLFGEQAANLQPAGPGFGSFDVPPGISFDDPLSIHQGSSVSNNRADPNNLSGGFGWGGGLFTVSPALIDNSVLDGNWAAGSGGGIAIGSIANLAQSGLAGANPNCLQGIFSGGSYSVRLTDSTVSNNAAGQVEVVVVPDLDAVGGGVYVGGDFICASGELEFHATDSLLSDNSATAGGGGIFVDGGVALLHNTNLIGNDAGHGNGGGSYNQNGYLMIDPANVIGNSAVYGAGGYYDSGITIITQTTFATNTATISGGGLAISGTASVDVANSTISANQSGGVGAGIYQRDDGTVLNLENDTIANNTAGITLAAAAPAGALGDGSGFYRSGEGITGIYNTIIFGNGLLTNDCSFTNPASNVSGLNNMGDATCSFIPGWTTDDPELGPLQYNGGQNGILTHALFASSPAIGAADTTVCGDFPVNGVDERDVLRLLDLACDIGAFEFETLTYVGLVSFTASAQGQTVTLAWKTAVEVNTAGFNLYRAASPSGPWVQVNALLIGAQGPQGGSYSTQDAPGVGVWYYKLEDVDTDGTGTLHGPVAVTIGSGTTANYRIYLPVVSR